MFICFGEGGLPVYLAATMHQARGHFNFPIWRENKKKPESFSFSFHFQTVAVCCKTC